MRAVPYATSTAMVVISLYLVVTWGYEGVWTLHAPLYGLGDFLASQTVYSFGRVFELSPLALMRLAAFLAAVKLVAVGALIWHFVAWLRDWRAGLPRSEGVLEGALLVAALLIAGEAVAPLAERNQSLMQHLAGQFLLVALIAAALIVERFKARQQDAGTPDGATLSSFGGGLFPWIRRWDRWPS